MPAKGPRIAVSDPHVNAFLHPQDPCLRVHLTRSNPGARPSLRAPPRSCVTKSTGLVLKLLRVSLIFTVLWVHVRQYYTNQKELSTWKSGSVPVLGTRNPDFCLYAPYVRTDSLGGFQFVINNNPLLFLF